MLRTLVGVVGTLRRVAAAPRTAPPAAASGLLRRFMSSGGSTTTGAQPPLLPEQRDALYDRVQTEETLPEGNTLRYLHKVAKDLYIEYTCKPCGTRNRGFLSRVSYEHGVVVCTCKGCSKMHLIADHLGWFDQAEGGKTVEEILAKKGEKVKKLFFTHGAMSSLLPPEAYLSPTELLDAGVLTPNLVKEMVEYYEGHPDSDEAKEFLADISSTDAYRPAGSKKSPKEKEKRKAARAAAKKEARKAPSSPDMPPPEPDSDEEVAAKDRPPVVFGDPARDAAVRQAGLREFRKILTHTGTPSSSPSAMESASGSDDGSSSASSASDEDDVVDNEPRRKPAQRRQKPAMQARTP